MINSCMTISVKILNDKIEEVSKSNTLLDMLMEFEKTLDEGEDLTSSEIVEKLVEKFLYWS